jgi:hypothetical protein
MAQITILDRKSAESIYNAANTAYDAKIAHLDRSLVKLQDDMIATMKRIDQDVLITQIPFAIIEYLDRMVERDDHDMHAVIRAWHQCRYAFVMYTYHDIVKHGSSMGTLADDRVTLIDLTSRMYELLGSRDRLMPDSIARTIENVRAYVPIASTVLQRGTRSFVVSLDSEEDVYRIVIRTHDSQVKVYSSARMHNAATTALALIDKLIERSYMVADGSISAMVIDKHTGTCSMRVMVDQGCKQTIDQIRTLARMEAKNVLPYERIKRQWYTVNADHVDRSVMPQCAKDASGMVMVRKTMHGKHVRATEYALSEETMVAYGIPLQDVLYYELQLPRDIVRMRKDSHGESVAVDAQTIDTIKLYVVDKSDVRIATMIERIKACKLTA